MEKIVNLSDYDREQNSIDQQLRMNISKTVQLVYCSCHIVLSTYANRMNNGTNIGHSVGHPRIIKEKGLSRLVK